MKRRRFLKLTGALGVSAAAALTACAAPTPTPPTAPPTASPTLAAPTTIPTALPTPTAVPTNTPTEIPTATLEPTIVPTEAPTKTPVPPSEETQERRIEKLKTYFNFEKIESVTSASGKNVDVMIGGNDGFSEEGARMTEIALLEIQKVDPTMFDQWVDNLGFNGMANTDSIRNGYSEAYSGIAVTRLNYGTFSDSNRGPAGNDGIIGKLIAGIVHETDGHIRQKKQWGGIDAKTGCVKQKSQARQPHSEADATQAVRDFIDRNSRTIPEKYKSALEFMHYANMLSYGKYFEACK